MVMNPMRAIMPRLTRLSRIEHRLLKHLGARFAKTGDMPRICADFHLAPQKRAMGAPSVTAPAAFQSCNVRVYLPADADL